MISDTIQSRIPTRISQIGTMRTNLLQKIHSTTSSDSITPLSTLANSLHTTNTNRSFLSVGSADTLKESSYHITRLQSEVNSVCSVRSQYRVSLRLTPKEISLIRYTWNEMLVEEPVVETRSPLPIPGLYSYLARNKPLPTPGTSKDSLFALSLFCGQFYRNLLTMEPGLELVFPSLKHQAISMAGVMSFAINCLENLSSLDAHLTKLGKRHSRILGVGPPEFELMGEALIKTFHDRFGPRFTHELELLWIKLFMYLSNSLLQFGVDPVLRLTPQVYMRTGIFPETGLETGEKDETNEKDETDETVSGDGQSESIKTNFDALGYSESTEPNFGPKAVKKRAVKKKLLTLAANKKKNRFGKRGDCVVM